MVSYVLLVGEGDFSFAVSLLKKFGQGNLIATCLQEKNPDCEDQCRNMTVAKQLGAKVFTNVDARRLHEHPYISRCTIHHIMFNFPHIGGKMKIGENRQLLKDFFVSAGGVLAPRGEVSLTLCAGQGGTPADQEVRRRDDTWKAVEMSAYGGFVLAKVRPFVAADYEDYNPVGYRSSRKPFRTDGALTHVFRRCPLPALRDPFCIPPHDSAAEEVRAAFFGDSHPLNVVATRFHAFLRRGRDGPDPHFCDVQWEIVDNAEDAYGHTSLRMAERQYLFVPQQLTSPCDPPFEHVVLFGSREVDVEDFFCRVLGIHTMIQATCNSLRCRDNNNGSRTPSVKHVICNGFCIGNVRYLDDCVVYRVCLEMTAAALFHLDDWRKILLWGMEGSLYPEEYSLDSSFWISKRFRETDFLKVARTVAGDALQSLTLLERYQDTSSGKTGMCYRFRYQSLTGALTRDMAKEIHETVRRASVRLLDVTLR